MATFKTSSPLKFIDNNENCQVSEAGFVMICSYASVARGQTLEVDYFLMADSSIVDEIISQVSVDITTESLDEKLNNNSDTIYVSRPNLDFNYSAFIEGDDQFNHYHALLKEGESKTYKLRYGLGINKPSVDYLKSATLTYETSNSVTLTNGQCLVASTWKDCINSESFDVNEAIRNGVIFIRYTITGKASEHGYVKFTLTDSITGQRAYKDIIFPVIVGKSTSMIQQKIDAAGEVIKLLLIKVFISEGLI